MAEQEKISPLTASRDSVKREHYAPIKHNKQRRKRGHDYTSVSLYLITVTTVGRQRILGQLVGNSADEAHVEATDLGRKVIAYFNRIPEITMEKTGCRVQVVQYQLMPDVKRDSERMHCLINAYAMPMQYETVHYTSGVFFSFLLRFCCRART